MSTVDLTAATFESTVSENEVVLVDFWASWCGPCRMFAPIYEAASQAHPEIVFASIDTEAERDRLADAYADEHLRASVAASDGHVDEIIDPASTRARLAWGLSTLAGASRGTHRGNLPL